MCTVCGYTADCAHENAHIERTPVDRWISGNDDSTHNVSEQTLIVVDCPDCGRTMESYESASKEEAHTYDETFQCTVCHRICEHSGATTQAAFEATGYDGAAATDKAHVVTGVEITTTTCPHCGKVEKAEAEKTAEEAHAYEVGEDGAAVCAECGYACTHASSTVREVFVVDAYTSNGASGHTVKGDTHLVERCDGCGAVFTDVVRTEGVSYDEPHTLRDGKCALCGYVKPVKESSEPAAEPAAAITFVEVDALHGAIVAEAPRMAVALVNVANALETENGEALDLAVEGLDELLAAEEIEALKALPAAEQMLVTLKALGYADEADFAIAELQLTLSPEALALIEAIKARVAALTEDEPAALSARPLVGGFDGVHVAVGGGEHIFGAHAAFPAEFGPAGAEGHAERLVAPVVEGFEVAAQAVDGLAHLLLALALAEQHELVAADAGEEVVALGAGALEGVGHAHQGEVARGVAIGIVDVLETVQVEHQGVEPLPLALRRLRARVQVLHEAPPVVQPCERVGKDLLVLHVDVDKQYAHRHHDPEDRHSIERPLHRHADGRRHHEQRQIDALCGRDATRRGTLPDHPHGAEQIAERHHAVCGEPRAAMVDIGRVQIKHSARPDAGNAQRGVEQERNQIGRAPPLQAFFVAIDVVIAVAQPEVGHQRRGEVIGGGGGAEQRARQGKGAPVQQPHKDIQRQHGDAAEDKGAEIALIRRAPPRALLAKEHDQQYGQTHGVQLQIQYGEQALRHVASPSFACVSSSARRRKTTEYTIQSIAQTVKTRKLRANKMHTHLKIYTKIALINANGVEPARNVSAPQRSASEESRPRKSCMHASSAAPTNAAEITMESEISQPLRILRTPMPHYIRAARGHAAPRRTKSPPAAARARKRLKNRHFTCIPPRITV